MFGALPQIGARTERKKPIKRPWTRAVQTCMGHGGGRSPPAKVIQDPTQVGQGFWADFQPASPDFHPFWVIFSGLQPGTLGNEANQGQKWIPCPQNRGIPCCQALGPPFVDPKAPLPGPAVGTGLRWARATVLTLGSTPEPIAGTSKGAFGSTKVGLKG